MNNVHVHVHCFSPCSFAALFSPAKRRQMEKALDGTPRRPILGPRQTPDGVDEEDGE